jgi:hypothetical protein
MQAKMQDAKTGGNSNRQMGFAYEALSLDPGRHNTHSAAAAELGGYLKVIMRTAKT